VVPSDFPSTIFFFAWNLPRLSRPPFDHINNVWRGTKFTNLLVMKSSSACCWFLIFSFVCSSRPVPNTCRYVWVLVITMYRDTQ